MRCWPRCWACGNGCTWSTRWTSWASTRRSFTAARETIEAIEAGITAQPDAPVSQVHVLPVCALDGDHLAQRGERMPWYRGPLLADLLLTLPGRNEADSEGALRFPVQG
jgi:sulfate adenylyltransferase subunit 1 (EFTu-like GTPase family)